MATEVVMPQMGESIDEATLTKWLVAVGDEVELDQPLFEVSTDKVDTEIPSPASGVLLEVRFREGESVPVNEIVALIADDGEAAEQEAAAEARPAAAEPGAELPEEDVVAGPPAELDEGVAGGGAGESLPERVRRLSSPLVRRIAEREGVDLELIEGTGIHGRVTKKDIAAYLETRQKGAPAPTPATAPASARASQASPIPDFSVPAYAEGEAVQIEPMSRIRQITAAHMRYSKDTSAHVASVYHVDMSRVVRMRQRAKASFAARYGTKLTFMPFIFRAVSSALRKHRKLNASVDGSNIVYKREVNLGLAVATDRGLLVPVLRNADQLSLAGLARGANDLAERARSRRLVPDELKGGTFSITNPGVFGSLFGTPIISQPQVAILGVGVVEKRPVVVTDADGQDLIGMRSMCYLALSYDHRLVDGADADEFMSDVKAILEGEDWVELEAVI